MDLAIRVAQCRLDLFLFPPDEVDVGIGEVGIFVAASQGDIEIRGRELDFHGNARDDLDGHRKILLAHVDDLLDFFLVDEIEFLIAGEVERIGDDADDGLFSQQASQVDRVPDFIGDHVGTRPFDGDLVGLDRHPSLDGAYGGNRHVIGNAVETGQWHVRIEAHVISHRAEHAGVEHGQALGRSDEPRGEKLFHDIDDSVVVVIRKAGRGGGLQDEIRDVFAPQLVSEGVFDHRRERSQSRDEGDAQKHDRDDREKLRDVRPDAPENRKEIRVHLPLDLLDVLGIVVVLDAFRRAVLDMDDLIGHVLDGGVVRDNDDGLSLVPGHVLEKLEDGLSRLIIQGAGRFVAEEDLGVLCQGAGN